MHKTGFVCSAKSRGGPNPYSCHLPIGYTRIKKGLGGDFGELELMLLQSLRLVCVYMIYIYIYIYIYLYIYISIYICIYLFIYRYMSKHRVWGLKSESVKNFRLRSGPIRGASVIARGMLTLRQTR